jgi:uncharacterized membrane protein/protein-disulfide isomerase
MSTTAARVILAFALLGLVASTTAAYTHYRLITDPSYLSFCDVSATVNCTEVYSSRFGTVAGLSVAVFGAIWFAFATLLAGAALGAGPAIRESVPAYLFAGSTFALSVILYLGYASFVVLQMVCVLCLMTYAAVIGLFVVSGAATSISMLTLPRRAMADLRVLGSNRLALALSVLFVATAASSLAFFPRDAPSPSPAAAAVEPSPDASQNQQAEFDRWYQEQPRMALVVPAEGASVLVVKFNDYQCPPCRQTYMDYQSVFAKYEKLHPGAVRLVLRDFPLEPECNDGVTTNLHPAACEAAVAVRLARERSRAEAVEEWLFANQPSLTPESIRQAARQVGQVTDMDGRYGATLEAVKADIAYGRQLGVRSTPTFFINGVMLAGGLPPHLFDRAIAYELQRAGVQ